ncbi:6-hydroxymethylpterin diphosphokinase MptE-like protein [Roseimarinus sediminis]|uniref:6-hydroxymethylpterin diphosphokinase MptE-like protein n=1 Tax=Roseimarinus sediminis TaxID=1610899 RepID=UPI003D1C7F89
MNKYKIEELSLKRIFKGVQRRIINIPHKFAWVFSQAAKDNRNKLKRFYNIHSGERCFLIANGPSLTNTNINLLANEITFGLNRIYLNYPNMEFTPNYLVCINKLVLNQFANDFHNEKMPKFFNWESRNIYKNDNDIYFVGNGLNSIKFSKDISKSLTPAATVTYAALQIIFYMGFKEVIIIGMDHSFQFKGKPNEAQKRNEERDINHFAPNYFPKGSKWETPDIVATEYFYRIAKQEFEMDERFIYDATINGKCTIFEKRDLESFF